MLSDDANKAVATTPKRELDSDVATPSREGSSRKGAAKDPIYSDSDDDGHKSDADLRLRPPAATATASANASAAGAAGSGAQWEAPPDPRAAGPKIRVRVTRDGKTTDEELDPLELAELYAQQQATLRSVQQKFDFLAVPEWVRLHPMVGPYLAEALGTFAWTLVLSLASVRNASIFDTADDTNMTSVPIGFMMTCMVFTFGYISGGHFNPAISIAVFLIRKMPLMQCLCYVCCQVAAALGAGLVAIVMQGGNDQIFVPSVSNSYVSSGIFSELIYTFAIAVVVLNAAYSRQSGSFFYGFAVGMTVAAGSASVSRISGGAFNPAAATGLQIAVCISGSCDDLKSFWVYWLAPVLGAGLASLAYSQMFQPENTQVLQDHKVFTDPAKVAEQARAQRQREEEEEDLEMQDTDRRDAIIV